jgi:hypothetical protein
MLFTSTSFYFSSILMILMCILLDEGTGMILRLFSCVKDQKFGMKCQNEEINCLESYPINEQSTKIEKSCTQ